MLMKNMYLEMFDTMAAYVEMKQVSDQNEYA